MQPAHYARLRGERMIVLNEIEFLVQKRRYRFSVKRLGKKAALVPKLFRDEQLHIGNLGVDDLHGRTR